jgi:hypothetical protein
VVVVEDLENRGAIVDEVVVVLEVVVVVVVVGGVVVVVVVGEVTVILAEPERANEVANAPIHMAKTIAIIAIGTAFFAVIFIMDICIMVYIKIS